jgi:tetratricopeptide (TPR) repeat protein
MSWASAALGLFLVLALNTLSMRLRPVQFPMRQGLVGESAVETSALVSLGMRRLAADLGLVRLLVYYGSHEAGCQDPGHHHHHGRFDPDHPELSWGGGRYPELGPRALRILDADPAFGYAALFASGALAFNLNRPEDALRVLDYALSRDPRNHQFLAYVAAIGFHRRGDAEGVVRRLEPFLSAPDCPVMIKHMVAFLYEKSGQRRRAIELNREIFGASKDPGYRRLAEAALRRLESTTGRAKSAILSGVHG